MSLYNILIWGIGRRTEKYMKFDYFDRCNIKGFVDTYCYGKSYRGYNVYAPNEISQLMKEIDYLIIATHYFSEIYQYCIENDIDRKKIIFTDYIIEPFMLQDLKVIKSISNKLYEDMCMRSVQFVYLNEKDYYEKEKLISTRDYNSPDYKRDYFRYRTFEFMANEIITQGVRGCVAELGVFRGVFSALINQKFQDRDLYLFDTFDGFDKEEAIEEERKGRSNEEFVYIHKLTSEKIVLNKLPYPSNCHICRGYFPKSVTNEIKKLRFAFVSIDVDFEESIYQGLSFFYPRLEEGGVIFLHDYNSLNLSGVKLALEKYESDIKLHLKKVPLADRAGTLVIIK